jgi:hypothetical protein
MEKSWHLMLEKRLLMKTDYLMQLVIWLSVSSWQNLTTTQIKLKELFTTQLFSKMQLDSNPLKFNIIRFGLNN